MPYLTDRDLADEVYNTNFAGTLQDLCNAQVARDYIRALMEDRRIEIRVFPPGVNPIALSDGEVIRLARELAVHVRQALYLH